MPGPAVRARDLTKRYGEFVAVKGVSFEVPTGAAYAFLGPNGAGKSSTMRMIYGLSPVGGGSLEVLGLDMSKRAREIKKRIGVVPQESNLDTDMRAVDNLTTHARFYGITGAAGKRRAREMLEYVALSEKAEARVSELSGGMKRRLLIARALMNDPELLVLDEPTTGLDPQSRALLWERIRDMRKQGKTIVLTTHYMDEAERLADSIYLMDEGRIIEEGAPRDLIAKHVGREVVELTIPREEDPRVLSALSGHFATSDRVGDDLLLATEDGERLLERVVEAGLKPARASYRRATLEDLFLKLTGRRLSD